MDLLDHATHIGQSYFLDQVVDGRQVRLHLNFLPLSQVRHQLFDEWHDYIDVLRDLRLREQIPLGVDDLLSVQLLQLVVDKDVLLGRSLIEPDYRFLDQIRVTLLQEVRKETVFLSRRQLGEVLL